MGIVDMRESLSKVQDSQECCDKAWQDWQEAGTSVKEAKRMAEVVHEQVSDHLERYRRMSAVYATTEEDLNDGLGRMSELIRDTAGATHSLSCGTTDRYCNEGKYLQVPSTCWKASTDATLAEEEAMFQVVEGSERKTGITNTRCCSKRSRVRNLEKKKKARVLSAS